MVFSVSLPGARIEEFFYEKLDRKIPSRPTNAELLGQYMQEAAKDFGPGTPYGQSTLVNPNPNPGHFNNICSLFHYHCYAWTMQLDYIGQ